jgi:hypothetical protein
LPTPSATSSSAPTRGGRTRSCATDFVVVAQEREDFRETPWHGRAAACKSCEGWRYRDELYERQRWELEQERAKVVMLIRHVQRLRLQRIVERAPSLFNLTDPMPEPERRRKRARLTLQMERTR